MVIRVSQEVRRTGTHSPIIVCNRCALESHVIAIPLDIPPLIYSDSITQADPLTRIVDSSAEVFIPNGNGPSTISILGEIEDSEGKGCT